MSIFVNAVAALLLVSFILFVIAILQGRKQKIGLLWTLLAMPLYALYYNDRWPLDRISLRRQASVLENLSGADLSFHSALAPAVIIAVLLMVQTTVFIRVAKYETVKGAHSLIANFLAGAMTATLVASVVVSTFSWGWRGAVAISVVVTLLYLGVWAMVAASIETLLEAAKIVILWGRINIFTLGTWETRIALWVSALAGLLIPRSWVAGLVRLRKRLQHDIEEQTERENAKIVERYKQLMKDRGTPVPDDTATGPGSPGTPETTVGKG